MSENLKTKGATIVIEKTGEEFHTFRDLDLIITNAVSISEPEIQTNYIVVPGSNVMLDASEALTNRPTFKKRNVTIDLAGIDAAMSWDAVISGLRNRFEGKVVHVIFDNDVNHYWKGRAHIVAYERERECGRFKFSLPDADPYKYDIHSNIDPWEWDPFDFENDTVPQEPIIEVDGTAVTIIPRGAMPTCPTFTVTEMTSQITMRYNGKSYTMKSGSNYFPAVMVGGDEEITLTFSGVGKVLIEYRGGSL